MLSVRSMFWVALVLEGEGGIQKQKVRILTILGEGGSGEKEDGGPRKTGGGACWLVGEKVRAWRFVYIVRSRIRPDFFLCHTSLDFLKCL